MMIYIFLLKKRRQNLQKYDESYIKLGFIEYFKVK